MKPHATTLAILATGFIASHASAVGVATSPTSRPTSRPSTAPVVSFVDQFNARVDALRAAGEPVDAATLKVWPTLPADQNGVEFVRAAATALNPSGEAHTAIDARDRPIGLPLDDDERRLLRTDATEQAAAYAAAMKITGDTRFDWGEPFDGSMLDRPVLKLLGSVRVVDRLIVDHALLELDAGNAASAFKSLDALRALADGTSQMGGLISDLVAVGVDSQAADFASEMAWTLDVGPADRQVKRADVERMIAAFTDRQRPRDRLIHMLRTERAVTIDLIRRFGDGSRDEPDRQARQPILTTFGAMNGLPLLDLYDDSIRAAALPDAKARAKAFDDARDTAMGTGGLFDLNHKLSRILAPSVSACDFTLMRLDRDRQGAAAALAIRLYRLDHGDAMPPTLAALVPAYLPSVPEDAQNAPAPLRYDAKRKILWGMGENAKDDNGSIGEADWSPQRIRSETDVVYFLDPGDAPHDRYLQH